MAREAPCGKVDTCDLQCVGEEGGDVYHPWRAVGAGPVSTSEGISQRREVDSKMTAFERIQH